MINRTHMVAIGNGIGFSALDGWRPVQVKFQAGRTTATEASRRGSPAMSMAVTRPWRMVSSITAGSRAAGAMTMRERCRQEPVRRPSRGPREAAAAGRGQERVRDLEMLSGWQPIGRRGAVQPLRCPACEFLHRGRDLWSTRPMSSNGTAKRSCRMNTARCAGESRSSTTGRSGCYGQPAP